jgi:hAT family C-terminal dimerisation region
MEPSSLRRSPRGRTPRTPNSICNISESTSPSFQSPSAESPASEATEVEEAADKAIVVVDKKGTRFEKTFHLVPNTGGTKSSNVWQFIYKVREGPQKTSKSADATLTEFACRLCVEQGKSLMASLVCLSQGRPANARSHMDSKHKALWRELERKRLAGISALNQTSPSKKSKVGSVSAIADMIHMGEQEKQRQVDMRVVVMMARHTLALSFPLHAEVTNLISAATAMKPNSYKPMTRGRVDVVLASLFSQYLEKVRQLVEQAHGYYGQADSLEIGADSESISTGWATICTDGWDSSEESYFGVSVMFILDWKLYKIPIGMATPASKKAIDCAAASLEVAAHVGIQKSDILSAVNDTTSSAVLTGRLLSGMDGDCKMHVTSLIVEHAIGKRTRSKNRVVVDEFPECEKHRVKHRSLVNYLTSSKAKQRYVQYKSRNESQGKDVIKVSPDNDTRVGGTHRMYCDQLRSRWCVYEYFLREKENVKAQWALTDDEWELTAQYEAVMRDAVSLNFTSQIDSRPSIGSSWLHIARAKKEVSSNEFMVVDLDEDIQHTNWPATMPFKELPRKTMTKDELDPLAARLHDRIMKELEAYLPNPDDDQLRAMLLDPIMITRGAPFLKIMDSTFSDYWESARELLVLDVLNELNIQAALEHPTSMSNVASNVASADTSDAPEPEAPWEESFYTRTMKSVPQPVQTETVDTDLPTKAKQIVSQWEKTVKVDWSDWINRHPPGRKVRDVNDPYELVECVNVLEWWQENQHQWPLIAKVAARRLGKPDANSHLERVFSFCKRVDHPNRRRLSRTKFEMLVLLGNSMDILNIDEQKSMHDLSKGIASKVQLRKVIQSLERHYTSGDQSDAEREEITQLYKDLNDGIN